MSTRSFIIVRLGPATRNVGLYARIYCHSDGSPSGVGAMLQAHYSTQALAEKLVKGGDLSRLGPECGKPPAGHSFDTPVPGFCVYYRRDRGEKNTAPAIVATLADATPADVMSEYVYLFADGAWTMLEVPREPVRVPLADAIARDTD